MRQNPHVRICGGPGSATTLVYPTNGEILAVGVDWPVDFGTRNNPAWAKIGFGASGFEIASTDREPFANRGDSGAVIFSGRQDVREAGTPAVGLLAAGAGAPMGSHVFACAMPSVFQGLQLEPFPIALMAEMLRRVYYLPDWHVNGSLPDWSRFKTGQLQRLSRDLLATPMGSYAGAGFAAQLPAFLNALYLDDEAASLLLRTLGPIVKRADNYDIMDTEIADELVDNFTRLTKRVARSTPQLRRLASVLRTTMIEARGKSLGEAFGTIPPQSRRPRRR